MAGDTDLTTITPPQPKFITSATLQQNTSTTSFGASTLDITTANVGDWVYWFAVMGSPEASTTLTGWTLVCEANYGSGTGHLSLYCRRKVSGDTTFTFSYPTAARGSGGWVSYVGLDPNTPNEAATVSNINTAKSGTTAVTASVSAVGNNRWGLACYGLRNTLGVQTWTADAATTERVDFGNSTSAMSCFEIADTNGAVTAGSHSYTATHTGAAVTEGGALLVYLIPDLQTSQIVQLSAVSRSYYW